MARNESWIGVQIDVRRSLFFSDIDRFGRELGDRQSAAIAAHGGIWGLPQGDKGVPRPLGDLMSTGLFRWGLPGADLTLDIAGKQGLRVLIQGKTGQPEIMPCSIPGRLSAGLLLGFL